MVTPDPAGPPRFFLALSRWFCNPGIAEDIEGDLLEDYHRNFEMLDKHRVKGAYASFNTDRAHWRYYWCD